MSDGTLPGMGLPGVQHVHTSEVAAGPASLATGKSGTLVLDTRRFTILLAAFAAVLVVVGAIVNVVIYQVLDDPEANLARGLARFDLGHEPSVPAWFSSMLLLLDAAVLLLIGAAAKRAGEAFALHWLGLGAVFVGLSIDEAALFHEMIDTLMSDALQTSGFLTFPWVLAGLGFVTLVFLIYVPFLFRIPARFARLFLLSGALYVGGAVGMELFSGAAVDRYGVASLAHTVTQTIEESFEMFGAILFFYALTEYWDYRHAGLRIGTVAPREGAERSVAADVE